MDSFGGSEPRDFIPFCLGTESNGQPAQTSVNSEGSRDDNLDQRPNVAEETSSPPAVDGAAFSSEQAISPQTSPRLLPTEIEIIEGSGSKGSIEQGSSIKNAASTLSSDHQRTPRSPSPDYSPSVVNPFASGNSSSGESVQVYLGRKIQSLEKDLREQEFLVEDSSNTKASESEPIMMIPSTSCQLDPAVQDSSGPNVSFLGPVLDPSPQAETERTQWANKRPRIGSASFHESHPQLNNEPRHHSVLRTMKKLTQTPMQKLVRRTFGLLHGVAVSLWLRLMVSPLLTQLVQLSLML